MAVAADPIPALAAVVWIDHWHAQVARRQQGRRAIVDVVRAGEPEGAYIRRVAEIASDCSRLMILGPDDERLQFDREFESIHGWTDLFVDVEASSSASSTELLDRLRLLEGDDVAPMAG